MSLHRVRVGQVHRAVPWLTARPRPPTSQRNGAAAWTVLLAAGAPVALTLVIAVAVVASIPRPLHRGAAGAVAVTGRPRCMPVTAIAGRTSDAATPRRPPARPSPAGS